MARTYGLSFVFTAESDTDADNIGAETFEAFVRSLDDNNGEYLPKNFVLIPDASPHTDEQWEAHANFLPDAE